VLIGFEPRDVGEIPAYRFDPCTLLLKATVDQDYNLS
jgi:hypothetical protein